MATYLARARCLAQPRLGRRKPIPHPKDEIGDYEAAESPALLKEFVEQHLMLASPLAIQQVVGAHDRPHPCLNTGAEVGAVDRVEGKMLIKATAWRWMPRVITAPKQPSNTGSSPEVSWARPQPWRRSRLALKLRASRAMATINKMQSG